MNDLVPHTFLFEQSAVRAVFIDDEPWFVGKDVCDALGHGNHRQVISRLDDDECDDVQIADAIGRLQDTTVVSEPGVYQLIFTSRTPKAKAFKRWLAHEVLPALRRTGLYAIGCESFLMPNSADRRLWGIDIAKVNSLARMMTTVGQNFGPEAARLLYNQQPDFPSLSGLCVGEMAGTPNDDPTGCLNHLLRMQTGNGVSVAQKVALSVTDRIAAGALKACGIIVAVPGLPNFVAIATGNGFLRQAFIETQWQGAWHKALLSLPGAVKHRGKLNFGGTISEAILVPRSLLATPVPTH